MMPYIKEFTAGRHNVAVPPVRSTTQIIRANFVATSLFFLARHAGIMNARSEVCVCAQMGVCGDVSKAVVKGAKGEGRGSW